MTTNFTNATIAAMSYDEVAALVATTQAKTAKAVDTYRRRSRKDFAAFMLEGRTFIKQMEASVSLDDQARILTVHQVKAATGSTSTYTPWIKVLHGKPDAGLKEVKFGGQSHVKWIPDDSFGRYFNFYEVIDREFHGTEDDLLAWVLERGGPAKIVADELERKREENKPSNETVQSHRDLYMDEAVMPVIDLPATALPKDVGEFVAIIVQKAGEGYRLVGVSKTDATADFDRLAASNYDALVRAKAEREAAAQKAKLLADAAERGRQEGAEQLAASMNMTVEQMREKMREMAETVRAKIADAGVSIAEQNANG